MEWAIAEKTVLICPAMKPRALACFGLSFLILFVALRISAVASDETGQPAPRFHAKTTSGEQYNNASIKGKVVLLNFWTTWCPG